MGISLMDKMKEMASGKVTKSQRVLLNYFLSISLSKTIYMSITQLAEVTGVAEATVLRFCRSLGCNGYQEFKFRLAQESASYVQETEDGEEAQNAKSLVEEYKNALDFCEQIIFSNDINAAVRMIAEAKTVTCCGVGHSYLAALELHSRFTKMGIISHCEFDMNFSNILVSQRGKEDVLVLFSVSGGTKDILEVASRACSVGMKIICITAYEKSPLVRYADHVIVTGNKEAPLSAGAVSSIVLQMFTVDVLCRLLHRTDKKRFDDAVAKGNVATASKLI